MLLRLSVEERDLGITTEQLEKGHEGRNITADNRNVKVPRELIGDTLLEARGSKTATTSFAITDMCGDAKYIQQARSWP